MQDYGRDETQRREDPEENHPMRLQEKIPPWTQQLTVRGIVASLIIGSVYSVIVMKLNLTTGLVPTLNVSAALLAFVFLKSWTKLLHRAGVVSTPFTGRKSRLSRPAPSPATPSPWGRGSVRIYWAQQRTYELTGGAETKGNTPGSYKEPAIGWITAFLFVTTFVGLAILIPLRKILILDDKLTFPSGTATAVLINGFYTAHGDKMAKKQVRGFAKFFSVSFLWSFFQWFFAGGDTCGFIQFPTFGLKAWRNTFFFDFSLTYVGAACCSPLMGDNVAFIRNLKGEWYPAKLSEGSMKSLTGYKHGFHGAFCAGVRLHRSDSRDGLYSFVKVLARTCWTMYPTERGRRGPEERDFLKDSIPSWLAFASYGVFGVGSVIAIPLMFSEMKWYYVVIAYLLAPILGYCNAYGTGLTDMNMNNGVVAGLIGCGLIKSVVYMAADLMHDFKTGYLTLTSPRSMLLSQAVGTAMGCVVAPLSFFLFYKAFDVGNPNGNFKAPYALVYRNMAILGKYGKWIPLPMVMAVPFLVGANFAIDMCVGSVVVLTWNWIDSKAGKLMVPAVASGLMCGDGLWTLPSAVLALAKIIPHLHEVCERMKGTASFLTHIQKHSDPRCNNIH
ncbi:unnamed protein product [Spirodela intermedia]|uniref:Uncharacterized protein n=1 Tax=Spirodela intermedia TaxID=51605 RepID=A0ABN7E9F6_SPIIN|nr:unnamed protein product [Spirodela intermedia]